MKRVTVIVCGNASGTHKILLMIIGKLKSPHPLKNLGNLHVEYRQQGNSWMTAEIFKRLVSEYFFA